MQNWKFVTNFRAKCFTWAEIRYLIITRAFITRNHGYIITSNMPLNHWKISLISHPSKFILKSSWADWNYKQQSLLRRNRQDSVLGAAPENRHSTPEFPARSFCSIKRTCTVSSSTRLQKAFRKDMGCIIASNHEKIQHQWDSCLN